MLSKKSPKRTSTTRPERGAYSSGPPLAARAGPPWVGFALGSNLEHAEATALLRAAARRLAGLLTAARLGPMVRSQAVSTIAQPDYLNTVLVGRSGAPPESLLAFAKALELAAGRRCGPRDAPRPLDVDLLFAGMSLRLPALHLPHPALARRRFVLAPLAAIAPRLRPAGEGQTTVAGLLAALGPPIHPLAGQPASGGAAVAPETWRRPKLHATRERR